MFVEAKESLTAARDKIVNALTAEKASIENELSEMRAKKASKEEDKRTAAKQGDLSENAEYHAAVEELIPITEKIASLETKYVAFNSTSYQSLINFTERDYIDIGSVVRLRLADGKEFIWMLVPSAFASISMNTLSVDSPVGSHLPGMSTGSKFVVNIKGRSLKYTIEEVL